MSIVNLGASPMMIGNNESKRTFREELAFALTEVMQMEPPDTVGNDTILNRYMVAHMGENHFKKEREVAKADLLKNNKVANVIETGILEVSRLDQTQRYIALSGRNYCLDVQIRKGAMVFDSDKLHGLLLARGIRRDEVKSIIEEAKIKQRPTVIFGVSDK